MCRSTSFLVIYSPVFLVTSSPVAPAMSSPVFAWDPRKLIKPVNHKNPLIYSVPIWRQFHKSDYFWKTERREGIRKAGSGGARKGTERKKWEKKGRGRHGNRRRNSLESS